jgi:phosphoribosylformylglycinamidine synthase I
VKKFAAEGGTVIGICNGFQILCESHLLPGALVRNRDLHFLCEHVRLRVENTGTRFTGTLSKGAVLNVPIAHGEGCYFADDATIEKLESENRILVRYCDARGQVTPEANPNGSRHNIAGITNEAGNVFGLMPHPERACDGALGSTDGRAIFESILSASPRFSAPASL